MSHARCYVVDPHGALLPVGVTGELYIGGETVACGYVQDTEDQRSRFIPDPRARTAMPGYTVQAIKSAGFLMAA